MSVGRGISKRWSSNRVNDRGAVMNDAVSVAGDRLLGDEGMTGDGDGGSGGISYSRESRGIGNNRCGSMDDGVPVGFDRLLRDQVALGNRGVNRGQHWSSGVSYHWSRGVENRRGSVHHRISMGLDCLLGDETSHDSRSRDQSMMNARPGYGDGEDGGKYYLITKEPRE